MSEILSYERITSILKKKIKSKADSGPSSCQQAGEATRWICMVQISFAVIKMPIIHTGLYWSSEKFHPYHIWLAGVDFCGPASCRPPWHTAPQPPSCGHGAPQTPPLVPYLEPPLAAWNTSMALAWQHLCLTNSNQVFLPQTFTSIPAYFIDFKNI